MIARLALALLALVLPPLALLLWAGAGVLMAAFSLVWLLGLALFWFVFAGPGALLMLATGGLAALVILLGKGRRPRQPRLTAADPDPIA